MSKIKRRNFLSGASLLGLGAVTSNQSTAAAQDASFPLDSPSQDDQTPSRLEFNSDGSFKVIQFNDTQDDHLTDKRTIEFMEHVLDAEKPGFVLINGDVISAGPTTPKQVYQAINNVVLPMESRGIPWAVTFGNHDEDSAEEGGTGVRHQHMTQFVRSYRHNRNAPASSGGYGASNTHLALYDAATARFSFWLLDSGRYHPETIGGQDAADLPAYDYIHPEQIAWYAQQSDALAAATGSQVEGLMFFHIPTYEHRDMWFGGRLKNGLLDPRESGREAWNQRRKERRLLCRRLQFWYLCRGPGPWRHSRNLLRPRPHQHLHGQLLRHRIGLRPGHRFRGLRSPRRHISAALIAWRTRV